MRPSARCEIIETTRHFLSRCRLFWLQAWTRKSSLLRRYAQAQHGNEAVWLRRLGVDFVLLGFAALLPFVILLWSSENEQQQLARMPLEQTTYSEGWQMSGTRSYVFFDSQARKTSPQKKSPLKPSQLKCSQVKSSQGESSQLKCFQGEASQAKSSQGTLSQGWTISCGRLYESLPSLLPPFQKTGGEEGLRGGSATPTTRLLCVEGAWVGTKDLTLSTESLAYQEGAKGSRLTSERPVFLQKDTYSLSSRGGGIAEQKGDIRLFQDVLWQAPYLRISAQGEARIKAVSGKGFAHKEGVRVVVLDREVAFSFQNALKRYSGLAQRAELHPCSTAQRDCHVFGNDSIQRIVLRGSVVFAESDRDASALWTLQAEQLVVEGEQARYKAKGSEGRLGWVRIALLDGTMIRGRRGAHDLSSNRGLLCGGVEVRRDESVLSAACLRYNLEKQQYSLESSESERELSERLLVL